MGSQFNKSNKVPIYKGKKLAIIGASYLQLPLVIRAKELGIYTLCFAWEEGAVCKDFADKFYPISIVEKEKILEVCKEHHIDGICSIASDVAAPTVAYISESLGLIGNSYECAILSSNKYKMRQALIQAGVSCPHFICKTATDDFSVPLNYPLIVKPTDRSGSVGVTKISQEKDLRPSIESAMEFSFAKEVIVEEYIEGREISVEFISFQGRHFPLQITDKQTTEAPHFVELAHHQPAALTREQSAAIYEITNCALTALGITNGASHSEYKITSDGTVYVMEIGARMGGDFIGSDLVELSTGYDFLRGVIEVALGDFHIPVFTNKKYSGVYFLCADTANVKHYIDNSVLYPEIVKSEQTNQKLSHVTCSGERSGYVIYQANEKFILS